MDQHFHDRKASSYQSTFSVFCFRTATNYKIECTGYLVWFVIILFSSLPVISPHSRMFVIYNNMLRTAYIDIFMNILKNN